MTKSGPPHFSICFKHVRTVFHCARACALDAALNAVDQPRLYIRIPVLFEKGHGKTVVDEDVNDAAQVMSPMTATDFIREDSKQVVGLRYVRVMRTVRPLCFGTWEIHAWLVEALAPAVCQMTTSGNFPEFIDPIGPFA